MKASTGQSRILICVDSREATAATMPYLDSCPSAEVEIRSLALGDYLVDGRILFERKTFPDLAKSIIDGRLFDQGIRLASQSIVPVIILEGISAQLYTGLRREAIQGALIMLTLVLGIPLLRSRDPEETVRLMLCAAVQARCRAHRSLPRHGKRPKGRRRKQLALLQELPGVGPERACRLLDCFGSVRNVMNASQKKLCAVPGIGPTVAIGIRRIVG